MSRLLAAAAAPPRPGEFAGEEAAVAAFRAARDGYPQPAVASARRRPRLTVGAGVWAAVIAATATAGAAVAAATQRADDDPRPQPSTAAPAQASRTPSLTPAVPSASGPGALPDRRTPGPVTVALCRSYLGKSGVERGKSLDTPAFRELIEAAGGRDRVTVYCEQAVGEERRPDKPRRTPEHGHTDPPGRDPSKQPGSGSTR